MQDFPHTFVRIVSVTTYVCSFSKAPSIVDSLVNTSAPSSIKFSFWTETKIIMKYQQSAHSKQSNQMLLSPLIQLISLINVQLLAPSNFNLSKYFYDKNTCKIMMFFFTILWPFYDYVFTTYYNYFMNFLCHFVWHSIQWHFLCHFLQHTIILLWIFIIFHDKLHYDNDILYYLIYYYTMNFFMTYNTVTFLLCYDVFMTYCAIIFYDIFDILHFYFFHIIIFMTH